ncbi:MAG: 4-phosphopantetheinyl transferase family protein, partial [Planctomycetales bacterium]|nr:4-phosphopantetheinyl transferase family protein [Planctomycetales bacterium]
IDFEPLDPPLDANVVEDAFVASERALLAGAAREAGEPTDHWIKAGWCAKEAVGKALGIGVVGGPRNVEIVGVNSPGRRLEVILHGSLAERLAQLDATSSLDAWLASFDSSVAAICLLPTQGKSIRGNR